MKNCWNNILNCYNFVNKKVKKKYQTAIQRVPFQSTKPLFWQSSVCFFLPMFSHHARRSKNIVILENCENSNVSENIEKLYSRLDPLRSWWFGNWSLKICCIKLHDTLYTFLSNFYMYIFRFVSNWKLLGTKYRCKIRSICWIEIHKSMYGTKYKIKLRRFREGCLWIEHSLIHKISQTRRNLASNGLILKEEAVACNPFREERKYEVLEHVGLAIFFRDR